LKFVSLTVIGYVCSAGVRSFACLPINPNKMKEVADWLEPFNKMRDDRFNKLESKVKKYKLKK
jgi:hypothetical protein